MRTGQRMRRDGLPIATIVLILVNVFVFLTEAVSVGMGNIGHGVVGIAYGAQYTPLVMSGETWRIFTSMFVHFGIDHLIGNMEALLFLGLVLEPLIGSFYFLVIYLGSGYLANLIFLLYELFFSAGTYAPTAGASGAIFGIYGALAATAIIDRSRARATINPIGAVTMLVITFVNSMSPGVNILAHLVGALGGFLLGLILRDYDRDGQADLVEPREAPAAYPGSRPVRQDPRRGQGVIVTVLAIIYILTLLGQ